MINLYSKLKFRLSMVIALMCFISGQSQYTINSEFGNLVDCDTLTSGIYIVWWDNDWNYEDDATILLDYMNVYRDVCLDELDMQDPPNPLDGYYYNVYLHQSGDIFPNGWGNGQGTDSNGYPYLTLPIGAHNDWINVADDNFTEKNDLFSTFSPRVAISYEFTDNWKINASAGRYYKIPPYTILGFRNNNNELINKDVRYTQSDHLVLGFQYNVSNSSYVSLESFYKKYDNYPVSVLDEVSLANKGAGFEVLGNEEIWSIGKGRSYGIEFLFQQKLSKNFYGIFSYTWFNSEFTGFDDQKYMPSVWDSRHLVSFTGGYKLKNQWEISSRFRFAGKTPYVPTDLEASLENYPEIILDYSSLGDQKLDVFSQLDLRLDKKWNFKNMALGIYIDIQNVLAQNNPQPPNYGLNRNSDGTIIEPRSLVEIPDDSGTLIPSIGIIWDF